jgi:twitching motility protein PilJ
MSKLNFFKNKAKMLEGMISKDTQDSNINTEDFSDKINFGWITKIKVLPVGLVTVATLFAAIGFYINYSQNLDKNRQELSHIADLRQLSERVEKNAILIKNADQATFNELEVSKNRIEKLLKVLNSGGKIEEKNTEIDPMNDLYAEKFNNVQKKWANNKIFIDSLLSHSNELVKLKKMVNLALANNIALDNSIVKLQESVKGKPELEKVSNQLYVLNLHVNENLNDLFSGDTFSLETGYYLVKNLRLIDTFLDGIANGNETLGIAKTDNAEILAAVAEVNKVFMPYKIVTRPILVQVESINAVKDIAKLVAQTAKEISATAENINQSFVSQLSSLNGKKILSILLFMLSLAGFALLALVFYERSLQALRFAKALEKNQGNEKAVNDLIAQMMPFDEGDFTQRVHVEDKFVLPIAEKVDNTREIFGNIVRKIKATSAAIQYSAKETDARSQELLQVSSEQYAKLESSIDKLTRITSEMDEVAQVTWIAQDESNQSRDASQEGGKLVQSSIDKMVEIRNTIQESSKKIKKSSESAQAITEVTGLIQAITRQIEVLALNAAIQAASSGESGREFTVVAQEVQRLAFDSKEATNKILSLVKEVQEDIGGAVSSMERTTQEVVEGAKLNDSAGQALKRIEELSQKVANRVIDASQKLEEKSLEMTTVSLSMKEVQGVSERSSTIVKATVDEVESLKQVSKELENSVHGFKVEE